MAGDGLTVNGELGRELRKKMRPVPICQVTAGRPTRMTREGFARACAAARGRHDARKMPFGEYCGVCRGKDVPAEIEFIELEQLKGEVMTEIRKRGRCSVCGKAKSVLERGGALVCSMCENLRSSIRQGPEVVLAQLRELAPDTLGAVVDIQPEAGPGQKSADDQMVKMKHALAASEDQLAEAERDISEWKRHSESLQKALAESQQEVIDWGGKYSALGDDLRIAESNLEDALKSLVAERETSSLLAGRIESMIDSEMYDRQFNADVGRAISVAQAMAPEVSGYPARDSVLLDLAFDVMEGRVTGLDTDRLRMMREVG